MNTKIKVWALIGKHSKRKVAEWIGVSFPTIKIRMIDGRWGTAHAQLINRLYAEKIMIPEFGGENPKDVYDAK